MESERYFCALCGCPFDLTLLKYRAEHEWGYDTKVWPGYRKELLPPKDTLWLEEAILLTDDFTELGSLFRSNDRGVVRHIYVLWRAAHIFTGAAGFFSIPGDICLQAFKLVDNKPYYVAIHEDCKAILELMFLTRGSDGENGIKSLKEFMDLCRSTQRSNRGLSWDSLDALIHQNGRKGHFSPPSCILWDHDYGGAAKFGIDIGSSGYFPTSGEHWVSEEGSEWLCSQPMHLKENDTKLENYIIHLSERVSCIKVDDIKLGLDISRKPAPSESSLSRLETLPSVALEIVANYLPLSSFVRLKRCSFTMYEALRMSRGFWLQQLLSGNFIPWLWEMKNLRAGLEKRAHVGKDWHHVIKVLVTGADADNEPLGLRNRRRIWNLARSLRKDIGNES